MTKREYYERTGRDISLFELFGIDLDEEITVEDCINSFNILNNVHKQVLAEMKEQGWHVGAPAAEDEYLVQYANGFMEFIFWIDGKWKAKDKVDTGHGIRNRLTDVSEIVAAWRKITLYEGDKTNG